jgi:hypothetical protein
MFSRLNLNIRLCKYVVHLFEISCTIKPSTHVHFGSDAVLLLTSYSQIYLHIITLSYI